jgi:hypothetical protein
MPTSTLVIVFGSWLLLLVLAVAHFLRSRGSDDAPDDS